MNAAWRERETERDIGRERERERERERFFANNTGEPTAAWHI
jgi:hypothetical protein